MKKIKSLIFFCIIWIFAISLLVIVHACTISFQNVSSHGKASDLIDDDFRSDAKIAPQIDIPF